MMNVGLANDQLNHQGFSFL